MRTLQDDINQAPEEFKFQKLLNWLGRSFKFHDLEADARHRQIQAIELVVKKRDSVLRQRLHKLERKLSRIEHELTRGKNETLSTDQKEEDGKDSVCCREGASCEREV